jgi:hypothetical protein
VAELRRVRPELRRRPERATTLLEVTIAASLVVVVIASVLSVLDSFTRAEHHLADRSDATQLRESALGEFARDLRAAGSIETRSTTGAMERGVTAEVSGREGARRVSWDLTSTGSLERVVDRPAPASPELRSAVAGLDPDDSGFVYLDADGRELVPGRVGAAEVARCAARVELRLASVTPAGRPLGTSSMTVSMRNRQEEAGC